MERHIIHINQTADGQKARPPRPFLTAPEGSGLVETFSLGHLVDCHQVSDCKAIGRDAHLVPVQRRAFARK